MVAPAKEGEGKGSMTLDTINLSAGSATRVVRTANPFRYTFTLNQAHQPIRVNVTGTVDITIQGIGMQHRAFSSPKPIVLHPGPSGLDMEITLTEPRHNLLPSPMSVTSLGFVRVDERRGDDRTTAQKVSTILDGRFSLNGDPHQLAPGAYLQFDHAEGKLNTIQLHRDSLNVVFRGKVQGMKSCQEETQCTSFMRTLLTWLIQNHGGPLILGGMVYLGIMVFVGTLKWRQEQ